MTAIAGIAEGGTVWIGGDAAGTNSWLNQDIRTDPKVFTKGEFVMGYCGSFRAGQLIEHALSVPKPVEGQDAMQYMVCTVVPAVRSLLTDNGCGQTVNGEHKGPTFLAGFRGSLYAIHSDYQVARVAQNYCAIGCGQDLALGSLHASDQFELDPPERLEMALQAAAEFSAGVRGPFTIKAAGG